MLRVRSKLCAIVQPMLTCFGKICLFLRWPARNESGVNMFAHLHEHSQPRAIVQAILR